MVPLSIIETSDHDSVPQGIHLAATVVHHSGEPGVDSLRCVTVAVTKQLFIDPNRKTIMFIETHYAEAAGCAPDQQLTPSVR